MLWTARIVERLQRALADARRFVINLRRNIVKNAFRVGLKWCAHVSKSVAPHDWQEVSKSRIGDEQLTHSRNLGSFSLPSRLAVQFGEQVFVGRTLFLDNRFFPIGEPQTTHLLSIKSFAVSPAVTLSRVWDAIRPCI